MDTIALLFIFVSKKLSQAKKLDITMPREKEEKNA